MIILVLGLAFCAAYLATAALFIIFGWEMSSAALWTCIIILTILFTFLYYLFKGKAEACPKCGKSFAMKEISRKTVGSRATTMDVERKVKNNKGEVIRTYTESVPATQYIYDCVDECKFCGHRRDVQRQATYRD